jgi:hypothetical protein
MALLGLAFFLIILLFKRNRINFGLAAFSAILIGFDFIFIIISQTNFNRTNSRLMLSNLQNMKDLGLKFFFDNPLSLKEHTIQTWSLVLLFCLLYVTGLIFSKKFSPQTFSLLLIGLASLSSGMLVSVFNPGDWHIFPGLIMLAGCSLLQWFYFEKPPDLRPVFLVLSASLLLAAVFLFFTNDLKYTWKSHLNFVNHREMVSVFGAEIRKLQEEIDQDKIVAIPVHTTFVWVDYRFTFYPRGITASPAGIADYVVYPVDVPFMLSNGFENELPLQDILGYFKVTAENEHYVLLERTGLPNQQAESRKIFEEFYPGIFDQ